MSDKQKKPSLAAKMAPFMIGAAAAAPLGGIGYYFNEHVIGEGRMFTYEACMANPEACPNREQWVTTAAVADQIKTREQWQLGYLSLLMLGYGGMMGLGFGAAADINRRSREESLKNTGHIIEKMRLRGQMDRKDKEIDRLSAQNRRLRIGMGKARMQRPKV